MHQNDGTSVSSARASLVPEISQVPLDYSHPDGPKAGIAIVKVPSRFSVGEAGYRGPILFNPGMSYYVLIMSNRPKRNFSGGPGGSGVDMIVGLGDNLQKLLGDEYDIIGFDPR